MYNVSNGFKEAIASASRLLFYSVLINDLAIPNENITSLELSDSINNGDTFSIGRTITNTLNLKLSNIGGFSSNQIVKPSLAIEVKNGDKVSMEYVPLGVFYIVGVEENKGEVTLSCYDKMSFLDEEYIPVASKNSTPTVVMNDICNQLGITFKGSLRNVTLEGSITGYSYREMIGFIASIEGGNAKFDRNGNLIIKRYEVVQSKITPQNYSDFSFTEMYSITGVAAHFGDVSNKRGDYTGHCVTFSNPFITDSNIDEIYNRLKGLRFVPSTIEYRGDFSIDAGDIVTIEDLNGDEYLLLISQNNLSFSGGLTGRISSIGESKSTNEIKEYKFKNKKSLTELNIKLGQIQAVVQGVEKSQNDLDERVKKAELEITAESIAAKVEDVFIEKDELNNYSTTTQMRSEIEQTANSIKNTVTESYYNKNEIDNKGYATSTELQQTATDFTYKFSRSGGYNVVRNGNAKNGQAYWHTYHLPEASWGIRNDEWTGYEPAIQINAPNGTTTTNAICQIVDGLIIGETYTFSALTATHRGVNQIVIANGEGTVQLGQSDLADNCEGGTDISGWKRISGTFVATSNTCQLRLCHYWGSTNSFAWFKQVQINRGSVSLPYSPHPSEIYDGIITMDKDGFDVATSYGAHTQFHSGGMSSYNNSNQRTLGIENGGISFHAWNNYALSAYITQSSLWGGSQSANGLAISTTANGTYLALGTSSLSDVNTTLNMDQALTISASDGFQPRGINFWKDVHAHGYGIRQLSHLHLAGSGAIQFDYLNNSPSTIYEAVSSGHSLYVMGGYQMHLGVMEGSGTPHGVIWMKGKTDTHSYTHWDFHNYTMYNMKTASTYANTLTKTLAEAHGVTSNVDGVRYLYRDIELINGKAVRNLPNGYKGCSYDIVSIVCKGRGQAWVESEDETRFEVQGDCLSVNVEIIIYPADDVMMLSTVNTTEAPVLELPEAMAPEIAPPLTNVGIGSFDFWNQYMYSKYLFNLKKVTQMSGL